MLIWRGVRARSGQSLAMFATGVVVVAGCVVAVGYSRATAGTGGSAAALVLLGVVALATQGAASARRRRYEIALAQLRGRTGLRLLRVAVAEPIAVLVVATVVGSCAGWLLASAAVRRWVGGTASFHMSRAEWLAASGVLLVSVVVVVAVTWRTTYEPLTDKLREVERPKLATATGSFLGLLVLLGAVVSVYQARELGVRHANWVSYVSPALLGLAAGQVGVWLLALLARFAMDRPSVNRRIGWFVTLRRLSRVAGSAAVIRIVVAAVAVAGVAVSAWFGAGSWRDATARMQSGGPVAYAVPAGALQAYAASHAADPQGRWLMAVTAAPSTSGGSDRDVFVDAPRWQRVAGSFFAGTPLASVSDQVDELVPVKQPQIAHGTKFSVTLTASSVRRNLPSRREVERIRRHKSLGGYSFAPLIFQVTYVDSAGDSQTQFLPRNSDIRPTPVGPGLVGYSAEIHAPGSRKPACAVACTVTAVGVQGYTKAGAVRVTEMSFGGVQLVPGSAGGLTSGTGRAVKVTPSRDGRLDLELRDAYAINPLLVWKSADAPAALVTPGLRLDRSNHQSVARGLDGDYRPVQVAGEVPALPLVGREGLLLDLGTALGGAGGTIPGTPTFVVARTDTPQSVLAALQSTGAIGKRHLVEQSQARIQRGGTAQGTLLYTLIAGFGPLIAALSLLSVVAEERRGRRREAASLRVLGVHSGEVTRGYRGEAEVLGLAVAVIAGAAVWVACRALLGVLPLVNPGEFGLLFNATPKLTLVVGVAVGAGAVVGLVSYLSFRLVGRSSPPRLLREET